MFEIKTFTKERVSELKKLKLESELEAGWSPPQEYLEEWVKAIYGIHLQDFNLVKIALINEKVIGYCISVKKLHNYNGVVMDVTWESAYIWDLFVTKECRNMGIGTALLNDAIAYLKSIGAGKVCLLVNHWNDRAKKFFEKFGFNLLGYFIAKSV